MSVRLNLVEHLRLAPLQRADCEAHAWLALALRSETPPLVRCLNCQLPSGAWPGVDNGPPNVFVTSIALIALRSHCTSSRARIAARRGLSWLEGLKGRESHWLWRWKFVLFDRHVRFDPTKSGWPWVPGTVSWVAPTAAAILALRAWRPGSLRLPVAEATLLDRTCLSGGWNAGNSVVFGVPLDPHPDFTAMALLALRESSTRNTSAVHRALDYLSSRLANCSSPYSLAWAVMALSAYDRGEVSTLREQLAVVLARDFARLPVATLALSALALESPPFTFREVS